MQKAVAELDRIASSCAGDPESAHSQADQVLLEFAEDMDCLEVVKAYEQVINACRWWACA